MVFAEQQHYSFVEYFNDQRYILNISGVKRLVYSRTLRYKNETSTYVDGTAHQSPQSLCWVNTSQTLPTTSTNTPAFSSEAHVIGYCRGLLFPREDAFRYWDFSTAGFEVSDVTFLTV